MSAYTVAIVALCGTGLLGCAVFIARYTWMSLHTLKGPWWQHETGWWLVAVPLNLAALFVLVIANNLIDDWPGRPQVTLILFTLYVVETWWPLRLVSKMNRPRRTNEEVSEDGPQTHP